MILLYSGLRQAEVIPGFQLLLKILVYAAGIVLMVLCCESLLSHQCGPRRVSSSKKKKSDPAGPFVNKYNDRINSS